MPGPWGDAVLGVGRLLHQEPAQRGHEEDTEGLPCVGLGWECSPRAGPAGRGTWGSCSRAHTGGYHGRGAPPALAGQQSSSPFSSSRSPDCFPPPSAPIIRLPWQCSPHFPVGLSQVQGASTSHQCPGNGTPTGPTPRAGSPSTPWRVLPASGDPSKQGAGASALGAEGHHPATAAPLAPLQMLCSELPLSKPSAQRCPSPSSPLQTFGKGHSSQAPAPTWGCNRSN